MNLAVFEQMIAEQPNITLWKNRRVFGTRLSGDATGSSIGLVARIENDGRTALTVTADFYIDATYEGDLIAAAKVPYRVGREGHSEHNEPLAPEQEDAQLQAYNFRFTATQNSENRVMLQKPVRAEKICTASISKRSQVTPSNWIACSTKRSPQNGSRLPRSSASPMTHCRAPMASSRAASDCGKSGRSSNQLPITQTDQAGVPRVARASGATRINTSCGPVLARTISVFQ